MRRVLHLALGLLASQHALAIRNNRLSLSRRSPIPNSDQVNLPTVPAYNFTMPVDHFNTSNTDTYPNRYFVNDTYYKPGGPVILSDFGEAGVSPYDLATYLAEWNNTAVAGMQLASKLNGLVIGWEHRYYGYSQPMSMDPDAGVPTDGVDGYKYLTVEQAIEDVAYFANNFNKTTLSNNKVIQNTTNLDPYHTPWIFVGGSYPGDRAAWSRLIHPEVFYASWSSSAPVETREDGSIYYDPLVRGLSSQCVRDIETMIAYVDDTIASGTPTAVRQVQAGAFMASGGSGYVPSEAMYSATPAEVGEALAEVFEYSQTYGMSLTLQVLCDSMESFSISSFEKSVTKSESIIDEIYTIFKNPGNSDPPANGISSVVGPNTGFVTFAAFIYGFHEMLKSVGTVQQELGTIAFEQITPNIDQCSWAWQVLSELGYVIAANWSDADHVVSQYYNISSARTFAEVACFGSFDPSSIPATNNDTYLLSLGGWNMTASNVMFTSGQYDPWRSLSVASQETQAGAPQRNFTQSVPSCNRPPNGTEVFGMVYENATHVFDMWSPAFRQPADGQSTPLEQGLDLFTQAWSEWVACFNHSRDDIRNGQGVDGKGDGANGTSDGQESLGSQTAGTWRWTSLFGLVGSLVFYTLC